MSPSAYRAVVGVPGVVGATATLDVYGGSGVASLIGAVSNGPYPAWIGVHAGFADAVNLVGPGQYELTLLAAPASPSTAVCRCTTLTDGAIVTASISGTTVTVIASTFQGAGLTGGGSNVGAPVATDSGFVLEIIQF